MSAVPAPRARGATALLGVLLSLVLAAAGDAPACAGPVRCVAPCAGAELANPSLL